MSRLFPLLSLVLLLISCGNNKMDIDVGKLYLITTTCDNGCIRFDHVRHNRWKGTYYVDEGKLLATRHTVTLKNGKEPRIVNCLGKGCPVLKMEKYEPPHYIEYAETWLYRDSVHPVKMEEARYATAEGYWTSYPDTNATYLRIYWAKRDELHMKKLALNMDVYMPCDEGEALRPLLVLVHGGAFFNGDKASIGYPEWARYFAGLGYVVVSVNYRMGFHLNTISVERAGVRAVQDVKAAIGYVVHNKDKYGVDPERVFVAGTSAGGITALNVAFMNNNNIPAFARTEGDAQDSETSFSIRAVGNMWGAVENVTILNNAPTAILSVHSKGDPIVPFDQGHPFKDVFGNDVIFPTMYGSKVITSVVGNERAKLMEYDIPGIHALHVDKDSNGKKHLNHRFQEIEAAMRDFFSEHMLPHPVTIEHVKNTNIFKTDAKDVSDIFWKVEGGIVLSQQKGSVRVLLFPEVKKKSITVSGRYKSGLTFNQTIELSDT